MSDYDIAQAFEQIENELLESMIRNFRRHRAEETDQGFNFTQWQAEQLKSLELYRKENYKKFGRRFSQLNGRVAEMLKTARADGNADAEAEILQAIKDGFKNPSKKPSKTASAAFFRSNDRKLDALIKAATSDLKRAETAILRLSNDRYRKAIYNAQVYAVTGAGTYEKAVDMACRDMLRAGLNCVEYKNGARHTLSDYAEMAVRTSNKRAYLYGEGEKRREWGITTVVVNNRRGGCPLCSRYVGRVFIDDVYSGGSKADGNYPLLSDAIRAGLFHPRCKDSTSTYFKGITTLQPVTEEELAEMERREKLEQKQSYCENEAKKNRRIAKHSLDADNKRIYNHRAEVFEQKAERIGKNVNESESSKHHVNDDRAIVDSSIFTSSNYRRLFDNFDESPKIRRKMYQKTIEILKHRSGTSFEDLSFIDSILGKTRTRTDYHLERKCLPSKKMKKMVINNPDAIIAIHNHPHSTVPSVDDLFSAGSKRYKYGLVVCHNGTIYKYKVNGEFNPDLIDVILDNINKIIYNKDNLDAQFKTKLSRALKVLQDYNIEMEVFFWK